MPGSVVRVAVEVGDVVTAGQPILWLEAMKMQHQINAPAAGVVAELPVQAGQQVDVGAVLAVVTTTKETADELHRDRGAAGPAQGGRRTRRPLRLRVHPAQGQARASTPTSSGSRPASSGFIGVNLPEQYGGGGGGMYELALVLEELAAAGCSQLMMVVSPAICGTVIARFGTERAEAAVAARHRRRHVDHGVRRSPNPTPARTRTTSPRPHAATGTDWLLSGRKIYVSGVDRADAVLIVGRTEDARTGRLKPVLFAVPTDAPGFEYRRSRWTSR